MKLFIDTESKVIKIEEIVNFGEWKEYGIETNTVIQWADPVVIQEWPYMPAFPGYPYWWPQPDSSADETY